MGISLLHGYKHPTRAWMCHAPPITQRTPTVVPPLLTSSENNMRKMSEIPNHTRITSLILRSMCQLILHILLREEKMFGILQYTGKGLRHKIKCDLGCNIFSEILFGFPKLPFSWRTIRASLSNAQLCFLFHSFNIIYFVSHTFQLSLYFGANCYMISRTPKKVKGEGTEEFVLFPFHF